MKIVLAQINTTTGNLEGNYEKIIQYLQKSKELGAELVVFPELTLTGYPPKDLLQDEHFVQKNLDILNKLASDVKEPACIVGFVDKNPLAEGNPLYNAAALLHNGEVLYVYYKSIIPRYEFFDQSRYFEPAMGLSSVKFQDKKIAITVGEDIWTDEIWGRNHPQNKNLLADVARKKLDLIINLAASPYSQGFEKKRIEMLRKQVDKYKLPILMCNQVGGNDELIFDGTSVCVFTNGEIIARAKSFQEDLILVDLVYGAGDIHDEDRADIEMIHRALVLGLRDYARKCGFQKAVVAVSGGIDSAVTCCISAEALGAENVLALSLPSRYSSPEGIQDAQTLCQNLGCKLQTVEIQSLYETYLSEFEKLFQRTPEDCTEQNIQARIRSNILMAISNKLGYLVISTGNKSELFTGYCTIYGDLTGGIAPLADVPKTLVYKLAREVINKDREIIPQRVIEKPPSAELRLEQKDSDDLPDYEVLDQILQGYLDRQNSIDEIEKKGISREQVIQTIQRIEKNEFKRRQAPLGLLVTTDILRYTRRLPIAKKSSV